MGAFDGLNVLELTWGIAGPMAGMMLADQGATVTRIEPPGDPFADHLGYRVWNRGKRSAVIDLQRIPVDEHQRLLSRDPRYRHRPGRTRAHRRRSAHRDLDAVASSVRSVEQAQRDRRRGWKLDEPSWRASGVIRVQGRPLGAS